MKISKLAAALSLAPTLALAGTSIDNTRAHNEGIVSIEIYGGKGSPAEKLYRSLLKVPEQPDNAMGGRYGLAKQAKGVICSVENDSHVQGAYTCTIKLSTSGDPIEPWR